MEQKRKSRAYRIFSLCAWLTLVAVGLWRMIFKDHGHMPLWALFQFVTSLIGTLAEITGLLTEPRQ